MPSDREAAERRQPNTRRQRWLFRLAALGLGFSFLAGFEALCALCGWGQPAVHDDPFVGFRSVRPLFVLNEDRTRYEIPRARQKHFCAQSFLAEKPENEYRIFCLGGSTVQGNPYLTETAFTTWLEISLQAADSRRRWKVVNCGGISYASYRLTPILEEVLGYEPDLIILCTGHNEFLEDRKFEHIRDRGAFSNASIAAASRLRTFTLMREGYARLHGASSHAPPAGRPLLPAEVEALLDYRGGLEEYRRDDSWRRNVIRQFRFNLQRMAELARDAGVAFTLVNPACNIGAMPPFKAEHRPDLSAQELAKWEALFEAARGHFRRGSYNLHAAIAELEQACEIDPLHAGGWYTLAECYRSVGRMEQAREAYLRAKELDVCPLRILQPMNEAILDVARETQAPLVDVQALFEHNGKHGIVGGDQMADHVHPTIEGHQRIADALADKLVELGIVRPAPDWQEKKRKLFQQQFDSLDDYYYLQGEQRLKSLRLWAQGRAEAVRPELHGAKTPRRQAKQPR
ncbi:MAG TPA: tetratricopeptide repeat protein [Pirellulales bacterium]|nr:tetratricopeptide repeat protein [Pirellulales bacterium]